MPENFKKEYKYIEVNGINIAYQDHGSGETVIFVHGFASFSYSWQQMLSFMPSDYRFISIDLKGYGYSEKRCDEQLSPFDQAKLLGDFIKRLKIDDFTLVGHSMGGAISLITLFTNAKIKAKANALILIDSAGYFYKIPDFIDDIRHITEHSLMLKFINEEILSSMVLNQAFYDLSKITRELVKAYADVLREENAKECVIASARQIAMANIRSFHHKIKEVDLPTLIIWGENDKIISVHDATPFKNDLPNAELAIIPECGHSPQEEMPEHTAEIINAFIRKTRKGPDNTELPEPEKKKEEPAPLGFHKFFKPRSLKMSRLIDYWSPGVILLLIFIKFLQLLKKLGFKASENGWRKATSVFLRNEHSKFMLGCFRLINKVTSDPERSKDNIVRDLAAFLKKNPVCHWNLQWRRFYVIRKRVYLTDITEAEFDRKGNLQKIKVYWDESGENFSSLDKEKQQMVFDNFIALYNKSRKLDDNKRPLKLEKDLKQWLWMNFISSYSERQMIWRLILRILGSTFITFETMADKNSSMHARLIPPNLTRRKHPGHGLLNILCRMTPSLDELDIWFQYHHAPVDGVPMQEMLEKLKQQWGSAGQIKYPALENSKPEYFYYGNGIFRSMAYVDFGKLMKFRKHINERYYNDMGGPATFSAMLIWGLAHYRYLRHYKFLSPVDSAVLSSETAERNIGLIFIRPEQFFDHDEPIRGFLKFQREFNQRLFATRLGQSESHELLELYAMAHPLVYSLGERFMSNAFRELLGTIGISVIRNAEMFVSPLTELQSNGFIAIGNCMMPTEDGKTAGAVSVCGSKEQVHVYIKAVKTVVENYLDYV